MLQIGSYNSSLCVNLNAIFDVTSLSPKWPLKQRTVQCGECNLYNNITLICKEASQSKFLQTDNV